jgi:hypothetical protein
MLNLFGFITINLTSSRVSFVAVIDLRRIAGIAVFVQACSIISLFE